MQKSERMECVEDERKNRSALEKKLQFRVKGRNEQMRE